MTILPNHMFALFSLPLALALGCGQDKQKPRPVEVASTITPGDLTNEDESGTSQTAEPSTDAAFSSPSALNAMARVTRPHAPMHPAPAQGFRLRQARGLKPADIQNAVDQFRADLGGVNNLNAVGTQAQGHREINWDGVPADKSAPNLFPGDFFKTRGALFNAPCNQLQVSAKASETIEVLFQNINPQFGQLFRTFSPEKLFTALGSRVIEVTFTVPGSDIPAAVKGFGSVFTDVDVKGATRLEYYDLFGKRILTVPVPELAHANGSLSFVGVKFTDGKLISKVRIIMGNVALNDFTGEMHGKDAVVADDFLYAEPEAVHGRL